MNDSIKETSLKLPIGRRGHGIDVRWIPKKWGSSYNLIRNYSCIYSIEI